MRARVCVCVTRARNPANDTTRHCDTKTRDTRAAAARISNLSQHRRHLDFKQLYIFRPVFGRRAHSVVMSLEVQWKASGEKINIPRGETHCLVGRDSAPIHGEFTLSRRRARSASGTGERRKKRSLALFPTTIVRDNFSLTEASVNDQSMPRDDIERWQSRLEHVTARIHRSFSPGALNGAAAPTLEPLRYVFSVKKRKMHPRNVWKYFTRQRAPEFQAPRCIPRAQIEFSTRANPGAENARNCSFPGGGKEKDPHQS